ncbi:hypothetical protein FE257_010774 [Aspergillus nanangensis]|uniref:Carrier domain-containing protein n=1 Tax=Aspergillus nanangensis TaxID=2582783 RepID=A0AAD4CXD4_ASPNN|nr:hypothetical protein FE257_010774 [Aspergillus nanangensis]
MVVTELFTMTYSPCRCSNKALIIFLGSKITNLSYFDPSYHQAFKISFHSQLEILFPKKKLNRILYQQFTGFQARTGTYMMSNYTSMANILVQHAKEHPDAEAVVDGPDTVTYEELLTQAASLASCLKSKAPVAPDEPVAILLGPGMKQVVAQVAVHLLGATSVPLEPFQPPRRIHELLYDIDVRRVIAADESAGHLEGFDVYPVDNKPSQSLCRGIHHLLDDHDAHAKHRRSHILFTSGSTGKPKPVQIQASSIMHLATSNNMTPLSRHDRVAAFNNPGFDLSLFEVWCTLIAGGTVVTIPKQVATDPGRLPSFLEEHQVTVTIIPTALFNIIASTAPHAFRGLRHVITAGEAANAQALRSVLEKDPPKALWNGYGPTEATTLTTMAKVTLQDCSEDRISIGQPIGKAQVYLLDDDLQPIEKPGVSGEICIAGPGKSPSYLNRDRENKERFTSLVNASPHALSIGVTNDASHFGTSTIEIYRTGDVGQWRRDNPSSLDYIGRRDMQVKHQGFRVELGEVERVLESSELVKFCVVVQRSPLSTLHSSVLAAYIIPSDGSAQCHDDIVQFARECLPYYMVPDTFELLSSFPLMHNGKVDRKALQQGNVQPSANVDLGNGNQSTTNGVDKASILLDLCREVLQVSDISPDQDLFLLGASSIQAAALIALIHSRLGCLITMDQLHENSCFARLLEFLHIDQQPQESPHGTAPDHSGIWKKDSEIVDDLTLVPDWASDAEGQVFLTGATGFVGVHLLRRLIEWPGVKQVACLCRSKPGQSATARVQQALQKYDLFPESLELSGKIMVLDGDIGDDNIGLGSDRFNWLTNWASVVFHVAAKVNFCESYQEHHRDNVLGTRNILKVATLGRRKAFHYMSSIDVAGPTGFILGSRTVSEDGSILCHLPALRYDLGYGQTQWTAEAMVLRMQERGLPVAIYRPGFIIGDSVTGASNPDDFITRIIVGSIQMGTFPRVVDMRFEYSTIDYVCSSVLHIASANKNLGHAYHILSPDRAKSITAEDTCALINAAGYPVRLIDYPEWVEQAAKSQSTDGPLSPLLPVLQERVLGRLSRWECAQYSPVYECTNSARALADLPSGEYIPFTPDILQRYIAFWNRKGFYTV